jgi:hypothetical protein
LSELYKKWWTKEYSGLKCETFNEKNEKNVNVLGLSKLGGVFLIVAFVLVVSLMIAILEFTWKAKQTASNKVISTNFFNFLYYF